MMMMMMMMNRLPASAPLAPAPPPHSLSSPLTVHRRYHRRSSTINRAHRLVTHNASCSSTRRDAILMEFGFFMSVLTRPAQADGTAATEPTIKWKTYVARDFIFQYPSSLFTESEELRQDALAPGGTKKGSPVLAELFSTDPIDTSKITVVQSQATKLKQTFLQVTDISQLGTPEEVVKLLLPPNTKILSVKKVEYPQAARDTGTPIGILDRPPISIYRYQVVLPNGQHAAVAIGAVLGRVILLGAAAPEDRWEKMGSTLTMVADSFKILPR